MRDEPFALREAVNVPDALKRDRLVRRARRVRAEAVEGVAIIEHWNRAHPDEMPISTDFEQAVIAWCDGRGPLPATPEGR